MAAAARNGLTGDLEPQFECKWHGLSYFQKEGELYGSFRRGHCSSGEKHEPGE